MMEANRKSWQMTDDKNIISVAGFSSHLQSRPHNDVELPVCFASVHPSIFLYGQVTSQPLATVGADPYVLSPFIISSPSHPLSTISSQSSPALSPDNCRRPMCPFLEDYSVSSIFNDFIAIWAVLSPKLLNFNHILPYATSCEYLVPNLKI